MKSKKERTGASWWQEMLSRREANGRIAQLGIVSLLAVSGGLASGCGEDEPEGTDVERDALDIQKEMGWNAGATDTKLVFNGKSSTDSRGTMDWSAYTTPAALQSAWAPKNSTWQPFVVPTLVQSLAQPTLKSQIVPVHTKKMEEAYSRGLGMREILKKTKNPSAQIIVVDLPGPEAVAYAAALADVADPVITFDNWPHPLGVVQSHETLGALLYYAGEVAEKAKKRPATAPALMILDANRLNKYTDEDDQFDNRYLARVPGAEKLQAAKITNVLYAVPTAEQTTERDDLNEDFTLYKEKGVPVTMIALSDFTPATNASDSTGAANARTDGSTTTHSTYYYGGGAMFSPWFFYHYPVFYGAGIASRASLPSTNLRGRSYTPTRRPTMFSSRTVGGGTKGVGRQRPSGFGRVSTRVGASGRTVGVGRSSSSSSGRSGSFGRSGGRSGG